MGESGGPGVVNIDMGPDAESALTARLIEACGDGPEIGAALRLARRAHDGAVREDGSPYLCHPLRAALILVDEAGVRDTRLACAALLHDVIEDGPGIGRDHVAAECGEDVARLVDCLTNEFRCSCVPRDERKRRYLLRVAAAGGDCLLVKLCDRLDNLRSLSRLGDPDKERRIRRETRLYLLPAIQGRAGAFETLGRLLAAALGPS